jgi:parallel beta-helix repeat protein
VVNNTCNSNYNGIHSRRSDSSIIANNTCNANLEYGIYLYLSSSSIVVNNTHRDNGEDDIYWYPVMADTTIQSTSRTETNSSSSLISRIGLFLFVFGLLLVILVFAKKTKKDL